MLGGTLYQDIPTQLSSAVTHQQKPPYHVPAHTVQLIEGTPLQTLLQLHTLPVNSYHHQGIAQLSARLKSMAASADGLVEAVYLPGQKFAWAIQWHPEFSYETDPNSQKIFKAFVDACR